MLIIPGSLATAAMKSGDRETAGIDEKLNPSGPMLKLVLELLYLGFDGMNGGRWFRNPGGRFPKGLRLSPDGKGGRFFPVFRPLCSAEELNISTRTSVLADKDPSDAVT